MSYICANFRKKKMPMCFFIFKATLLYYPVQPETTHIHLCSGDISCTGHSNAGVRENTGRYATSSQVHPSPFATRSQLRLEEGRTETLIPSYLADRSVTWLVQVSADSREDEGWTSGKGAQNVWAPSPEKQNVSASLEVTHTNCRTHKAHRLFSTNVPEAF